MVHLTARVNIMSNLRYMLDIPLLCRHKTGVAFQIRTIQVAERHTTNK